MYTLVTGGTGFIGKNLINDLVKENRKIKCLVREDSDALFLEEKGVKIVRGEIGNYSDVERAMKDVDVVYHLAGRANPSIVYKYKYYECVNVKGTMNVLEAGKNNKSIKKIVVMSSIAATGPSRDGNLLDETSKLKPITQYGVSKVEVEKLCRYYYDNFNVPVVTIRPPMVYGVYDKDWLNFFSLIKFYVINDKKLPMPGDHTNLFDFCYVGNLVHGLIQAEKSDKTCGKIYFLTDNKTYTIKELLTAITNELHIKYPTKLCNKDILYLQAFLLELKGRMQKKDPLISRRDVKWMTTNYWVCSCKKAKKEFNYNPSITLEEGIKRTIAWGKAVSCEGLYELFYQKS